ALIFGTLLSSQGTVASFVLTLSGFPPGASLRCFKLYQAFSVSLTTLLRARRRRSRDQDLMSLVAARGWALFRASLPRAGL
ncbi:hypothetical protein, partial [Streptomyces achromogenes]|uniref:hypothetical protein n=1 Tax=Streptomyces achromogenes TaxID=67255 RepID=UPI00367FA72E